MLLLRLLVLFSTYVLSSNAQCYTAETNCYREDVSGSYGGTADVTEGGLPCQRWDVQSPHKHNYTVNDFSGCEAFPDNHCRVLDRSKPWCFTNDSDKLWDFCDVPVCGDPICYHESVRGSYVGNTSVTQSGLTCQRWDSQIPHVHDYDVKEFSGDTGNPENFCRVGRSTRPWCYTSEYWMRWEWCDVPRCLMHGTKHRQCYERGVTGSYVGTVRVTRTGRTCQRWEAQSLVTHDYVAKDFIGDRGRYPENYCRVMKSASPWCYTTDPAKRWERCDVPPCGKRRCYRESVSGSYVGTVSVTETGRKCQRWDVRSPHDHTYTIAQFPADLAYPDNHCRVLTDPRPWCFTVDADKRWEYCDIPLCGEERCFRIGVMGSYVGTLAVTETGRQCQRWDEQTPHTHDYKIADFTGDRTYPQNYCRVLGDPRPWCFTADAGISWEWCDVPVCPNLHCYRVAVRGSYVGTVGETITGRGCQRWDSRSPHEHGFKPSDFPGDGGYIYPDNHCRVLDEHRPWCYTVDPDKRWEYCNVEQCGEYNCYQEAVEDVDWYVARGSYVGNVKVTKSGLPCQRWDVQSPHKHTYTVTDFSGGEAFPDNHCRVLERSRPWCFTNDPGKLWDFCDVPVCGRPDCYRENVRGSYVGHKRVTVSGYTCQRWDVKSPHHHDYEPSKFPGYNGHPENYCRILGDPWPWCFTTDPDLRWEVCDVPQCR